MRFYDLGRGITIASNRVEHIKEADFFISLSIAAVIKALEFIKNKNTEDIFGSDAFILNLEGLDFAGAGTLVEEDMNQINQLLKGFTGEMAVSDS